MFEDIVHYIHCISRSLSEFNPSGKLTNILYVTKSKLCGVIHRLSRWRSADWFVLDYDQIKDYNVLATLRHFSKINTYTVYYGTYNSV